MYLYIHKLLFKIIIWKGMIFQTLSMVTWSTSYNWRRKSNWGWVFCILMELKNQLISHQINEQIIVTGPTQMPGECQNGNLRTFSHNPCVMTGSALGP